MTSPMRILGSLGMGELNPILGVSQPSGRVGLATSGPAAVRSKPCAGCTPAPGKCHWHQQVLGCGIAIPHFLISGFGSGIFCFKHIRNSPTA